MPARIYSGVDIAMKVPPHQYEATVALYRDVVGLLLIWRQRALLAAVSSA